VWLRRYIYDRPRDAIYVIYSAVAWRTWAQMKKLARRQSEDGQQTGAAKDKKAAATTAAAAAASKNNNKRTANRDDDVLRRCLTSLTSIQIATHCCRDNCRSTPGTRKSSKEINNICGVLMRDFLQAVWPSCHPTASVETVEEANMHDIVWL